MIDGATFLESVLSSYRGDKRKKGMYKIVLTFASRPYFFWGGLSKESIFTRTYRKVTLRLEEVDDAQPNKVGSVDDLIRNALEKYNDEEYKKYNETAPHVQLVDGQYELESSIYTFEDHFDGETPETYVPRETIDPGIMFEHIKAFLHYKGEPFTVPPQLTADRRDTSRVPPRTTESNDALPSTEGNSAGDSKGSESSADAAQKREVEIIELENDYINNLDLDALLRWNILKSIKDTLLVEGPSVVPPQGAEQSVRSDMGMLLLKREKTGEVAVSMPALATPLPPEIRKGHSAPLHSTPRRFHPTIVRLTEHSARNPMQIQVPTNLTAESAQKLKTQSF